MTGTLAVQPQNLDYYNYFVMCNYVFDDPDPVIQNAYTYEENGVLYCASATEKGVNRYSYARNNPLMYTDPSGEFAWFAPLIAIGVSAAIAAVSYTIQVAASPGGFQNWSWDDFGFSVMMGVAQGLLTSGIGSVFGGVGASFTGATILNELGRAGAHAVVGGMFSYAMNGDFWSGAAVSFASSLVGSVTSGLPALAQIITSTIIGGLTAELTGGTFWQGAVTGFAVSAFNHALHVLENGVEKHELFNRLL
jgi:hypothetical protein